MKVKLNADAYKSILTTDWARVSADDVSVAWIINRALSEAGHPPMFDIDDTGGGDALVILAPASDGYGGEDALDILYPDVDARFARFHDLGDVYAVHRRGDGRLLGYLTTYYGSNGKGKLAAQDFDPAPGVTIKFD